MILRLQQLGEEPFQWQESLQLTPEELKQAEILEFGEADFRGEICRTVQGFQLRGSLIYEQTHSCTRCLEPLKLTSTGDIDLLVLVGQQEEEDEIELSAEDLGVLFLPEPILDTRPLLIEQVNLGVPLKTLCSDDCLGLCRQCGKNLNQGPCACQQQVDPRWTALKNLKSS